MQYGELARAPRVIGAGWVVDEVEDAASLGKSIPFSELSDEELDGYEMRVQREELKGLSVGRPRSDHEVGVPYGPEELLKLLSEAAERAIDGSVLAHRFVTKFALDHGLESVEFEAPIGADVGPVTAERVGVTMVQIEDAEEEFRAALRELLAGRVIG